MVSDVQIIRPQGRTVQTVSNVQPAGQEAIASARRNAADLNDLSANIMRRTEENAYNDYQIKLSEGLDRIERENQANPEAFKQAHAAYFKSFVKEVKIPTVRKALSTQYTADVIAAGRRVEKNFAGNLDQNGQLSALKGIDTLERELGGITTSLLTVKDPVEMMGAQTKFKDILGRYQNLATQRRSDGSMMFSPEFVVAKEGQLMDSTLGRSIVDMIKADPDPIKALQSLKDGSIGDFTAVLGYKNPLDALSSPDKRAQVLAQAEVAINERAGAVKNSWKEVKAQAELNMAIDPLAVDLQGEYEKFTMANQGLMTPEIASEIYTEHLGLMEKHVKAVKDFSDAAPYLSGTRSFDGTDESKKAIETGYDMLKKKGLPMADRAKWLTDVNINQVPQTLAAEMESGLQAALMNGDIKLAGDLAETYDVIQQSGPVMIGDLDGKLDDRSQAAIMRFRDLVRIGGVGPDAFKEIRRIMDADPTTIDERKKDLTAFEKTETYRAKVRDLIDPGIFSFAPKEMAAVTGQAAVDYRKIFETKYLATGDQKYAKEATEKLVKGMYAKTQFSKDGFMRMPPEAVYQIPNDADTTWMKADLQAAYEALPGFKAEDAERLQLVADPRADFKTSKPEYLVTLSDTASDRFDSTGYVWKPDVEARTHFLRLKQQGKLDERYMTKSGGINTGYDYGAYIRDWNKGVFKRELSAIPVDHVFDVGIIQQESQGRQFDPLGRPLTSNKGAIGIAQVMPGTAPEAAKLAGLPFDEQRYKTDAEYNKALGRAYFKKQVEDYGDVYLGIMAYNAGPGAVDKFIQKFGDPRKGEITMDDFIAKVPYAQTRNYVLNITKRLKKNAG